MGTKVRNLKSQMWQHKGVNNLDLSSTKWELKGVPSEESQEFILRNLKRGIKEDQWKTLKEWGI